MPRDDLATMDGAPTDLGGRAVIVSGGARGIGGGVVRLLAARGAKVLIGDVLEPEGRGLAAELGGDTLFEPLDVTDEDAWVRIVERAQAEFARVDALINCAGILINEALLSFDRATFDRVLQVNLTGTFLGMKHAAAAMVAGGRGGAIVNLSSTEGLQGSNSMAAYASSKWGVRGLTKVAAVELGQHGIRVNSIHPGPINTDMVNPAHVPVDQISMSLLDRMPISRVADVAEVAELCAYLVGGGSRFVTAAEITIDGGLTAGMFLPQRPGAPQR